MTQSKSLFHGGKKMLDKAAYFFSICEDLMAQPSILPHERIQFVLFWLGEQLRIDAQNQKNGTSR